MKEGISGAGKFYEIFRLLQAYARCPILSVCILADVIYYYYPLYHGNTQYLTGILEFMEIYRLNYLRSRMDVLSNRIIASVGWPK